MTANEPVNTVEGSWERDVAELLGELTRVQSELLDVLDAKRACMGQSDLDGTDALRPRAEELLGRLQACHQRRTEILASAARQRLPSTSLGKLATCATPENRGSLAKQVKEVNHRMHLLQHNSLANWVLAQRTLLHLAQMLEIIATGGRLQPTYGKRDSHLSGGALVDHEA